MGKVFTDWQKALSDFKDSVEKDLEEIRQHKAEVQALREKMYNEFTQGKYYRDNNRIILSAPEIIIGNVDKSGDLIDSSGSTVIIRGVGLSFEGIGKGGNIELKASRIFQEGIDPGIDGQESVAGDVSQIVTRARNIVIQSNSEEEIFTSPVSTGMPGSIVIHADSTLDIEATASADQRKKDLSNIISDMESEKNTLKSESGSLIKKFGDLMDELEELLEQQSKLTESEDEIRQNIQDVLENGKAFSSMMGPIYLAYDECSKKISRLAELSRRIKAAKKQKDDIKTGTEFTDNPTYTKINIVSEQVDVISGDGEGNLRKNPGSGVNVLANNIALRAHQEDGSLQEEGAIDISALSLNLSTADSKNIETDKNGLTKGDFEAKGNIVVRSKEITFETVDYEVKDKKIQEKSLTKDGKFSVRTQNFEISTNDTEGKATGDISMNSKSIILKSMDVDKEKGTDKSLTEGSSMLLISDKMYLGSKDKDTQSKLVQTSSETVGVFAKTTYELQQGEKKGIVQVNEGKVELSGDKLGLYGETTVNGKTTFKAEITGPKAEMDSLTAKSQFKSPNISDGMAAGGGGGGGTLSAKLTLEDAPKKTESKGN